MTQVNNANRPNNNGGATITNNNLGLVPNLVKYNVEAKILGKFIGDLCKAGNLDIANSSVVIKKGGNNSNMEIKAVVFFNQNSKSLIGGNRTNGGNFAPGMARKYEKGGHIKPSQEVIKILSPFCEDGRVELRKQRVGKDVYVLCQLNIFKVLAAALDAKETQYDIGIISSDDSRGGSLEVAKKFRGRGGEGRDPFTNIILNMKN